MSKKTKKRLAALEAKVEELAARIERDFLTGVEAKLERDILEGGPVAQAIEALTRPDFAGAFKEGLAAAATEEVFGPRDSDGWYAWNGDETMRPAGAIQYVLRGWSGEIDSGLAENLRWTRRGTAGDIVKWRPAQ